MNLSAGRIIGIKAVRAYKLVISPWLPPACRFVPTCSEYAHDAIEQHGLIRGARAPWLDYSDVIPCIAGDSIL